MEVAKSLTAGPPLLFFLAVFQLKKGTKILHVVQINCGSNPTAGIMAFYLGL